MRRTKHIAFYTLSFAGGGAERVFLQLAIRLVAKGYKVSLVLAKASGINLQYLPKEVEVVDLKSRHALTSLPKLMKYLQQNKPDVLLSTQHYPNTVALLASSLAGFKGKLILRQANMLTQFKQKSGSFIPRFLFLIFKSFLPKASKVIALNESMANELLQETKLNSNKIEIINNPVDIGEITQKAKQNVAHPWLEETSDLPVLLAVGRFYPQKNFHFLLKAFAEALKERELRLIILGDGPLRSELNALAQQLGLDNHLDMPGFEENPYAYMARSSAFVLSSSWEGFPNVLVEAMACDSPVIATDCPGACREILEDGKWGELVEVDNIEAMKSAILRTVSDESRPDVRLRVKDFSIDKIANKYTSLLD